MEQAKRDAWHGPGADVRFEPADFEVIDLVLGQVPELRICALALKRARALNLKYPVKNAKALSVLVGKKQFVGGGHKISADAIGRYMPAAFFPLADEGALISGIYMALVRCQHEEALRVHVSRFTAKDQAAFMGAEAGEGQ